jgi:vitamin B12 transporter
MNLLTLLVLPLVVLPSALAAQEIPTADPVVVTATKLETSLAELGSSVTVITGEELRSFNYVEVEDALRTVPGLEVVRSGSAGKLTSISIRGANSNQVQVLVDGMRVKSPSVGQFDFSDLSLDAIHQIEVVRGPQSTLYGADAIGGVIHIITRKGSGPPRGALGFEGGSWETFRGQAALSGSAGGFNYALSGSRTDSRGQETRFDNDDSRQTAFAGRIGYDFPWAGSLTATGRFADSETGVPHQGFFPFALDPDSRQATTFALYTVRYDQELFPWWRMAARVGQMWNDQTFENGPLPPGDFPFTSRVDTSRFEAELLSSWEIGRIDTLTVGFEQQREQGENVGVFDRAITTRSGFLQNQLRLFDRLYLTAGLRYDDNDTFGDELTPRVSLAYLLRQTGTTLRGAYGEGFRAPTLNDLFFPDLTGVCPPFGNPNLRPERSRGWEAGADQALWRRRVRFGLTYFRTDFRDLISVVPVSPICAQAGNVGRARAQGVETYAQAEPLDWLHLGVSYTFADTENRDTGQPLPRIPRHHGNAVVVVTPTPRVSLFVQALVLSAQLDPVGAPGGADNPGYYRIDAGGTLVLLQRTGILDRLDLTARIQNLTDNRYAEVAGFPALGFTALAGLTAHFR